MCHWKMNRNVCLEHEHKTIKPTILSVEHNLYVHKLSYIYTFQLTGSHCQAAYESKEIQNFTAATGSQV
jgi:hypothetical protein